MAKIRTSTITYDPYKNIMNVRTCSFDYRFLTGVCSDCVIYLDVIKIQMNPMKASHFLKIKNKVSYRLKDDVFRAQTKIQKFHCFKITFWSGSEQRTKLPLFVLMV